MNPPVLAGPMTAATLRTSLRAGRRQHRTGSTSEFMTDVYMALLFVVIYGWAVARTVADYVGPAPGTATTLGTRSWLTIAVLIGLSGVAARALAALGPLFATPAGQTWALSTPVSRRGWLWPWLTALLLAAAGTGAVLGLGAGAFAQVDQLGGAIFTGAVLAATIAALAVVAQGDHTPRWAGWLSGSLIGVGVTGCVAVVVVRRARENLPDPATAATPVALVGALACCVTVALAVRALGRVDRAALSGGAELASAVTGAATLLDPTLLADVVAARRWRAVGSVRSRHWHGGQRWWLLLQAEFRRVTRRPNTVLTWAALALVPYLVDLVWPVAVGPIRIIAGYLAVDRIAGGLRHVCRSTALRRGLGGTDAELRLAHLVAPALGLSLWWAGTAAAGAGSGPVLTAVLAVGVLAAVYRSAGRQPISYAGMAVDTPFGLLPLDLLRQVLRGPDVLAVVLLVEAVAGG